MSFTFDDFPRSAYVTGGSILRNYGACGTYYVAAGLVGKQNDLGEQARVEDLASLVADGHELGSHTYSHSSCLKARFQDFRADAEKGQFELRNLTGKEDSGNFAYPYGEVSFQAKRELGPLMTSCRGTVPGINFPEVDLNLLRANRLYGDLEVLPHVQDLIAQNQRIGGWLIFYSHDVTELPSRFGCTPRLLQAAVSMAVKHPSRVLTVAEALHRIEGDIAEAAFPQVASRVR